MAVITLIKEKLIAEDVVFGLATVEQSRGTGTEINSSHIPYTSGATVKDQLDIAVTDQELIDALALKADLAGRTSQIFNAATATTDTQVVPKGQMDTALALKADQTAVDLKADKSNVLELDNTDPFTPTVDTQPATKKYVDDKVTDIGAGDMRKSVYDTNNSGIVDTTEGVGIAGQELGVTPHTQVMRLAQAAITDLNVPFGGFNIAVGTDVANAPMPGAIGVEQMDLNGNFAQRCYSFVDRSWFYREGTAGQTGTMAFSSWERMNHQSDIQNDLLGEDTLVYKVLHAQQGKVLDDKIRTGTGRALSWADLGISDADFQGLDVVGALQYLEGKMLNGQEVEIYANSTEASNFIGIFPESNGTHTLITRVRIDMFRFTYVTRETAIQSRRTFHNWNVSLNDSGVATEYSTANKVAIFPAGMAGEFYSDAAPQGWLTLGNTIYNTADYPELFAAIGHTYDNIAGRPTNSDPDKFMIPPQAIDGLGLYNRGVGSTNGGVGTYQGDVFKSHTHLWNPNNGNTSTDIEQEGRIASGATESQNITPFNVENTGDSTETRPRSMTVLKCISAGKETI